jgi:hypothetical protein
MILLTGGINIVMGNTEALLNGSEKSDLETKAEKSSIRV